MNDPLRTVSENIKKCIKDRARPRVEFFNRLVYPVTITRTLMKATTITTTKRSLTKKKVKKETHFDTPAKLRVCVLCERIYCS